MKLHEYQSKSVFAKYGVPIPKGRVAGIASEAKQIAEELGGRVVVKAQVLVGGRGKAGGIRLAKSPQEAEELTTHILAMNIKGMKVRKVLIDEAVTIVKEIYLGITNDRTRHCPVMMGSSEGGMEIEEVARKNPEKILKVAIDPLLGLRDYQARDLAVSMDLPKEYWKMFITIANGLWRAYQENDATLAEINPLVITADNRLLALDGKMVIDDNALYRHSDLSEARDQDEETPGEVEARKYGLSFIKLDGEIGCMVNGAGLAMATMDLIKFYGGSPANFLDIGGGAAAEKVASGLRIILSDPNVKAVLINIFGGITRGDEVARGILSAHQEAKSKVPMIVRLVGTNAEEGLRLLTNANFVMADTLVDAAQKAIAAAREGTK
ncbi:succinyl-CoA synthetase, beta subunit [Longilinea arvoryzae]|uniref:Succinate--CoA ligase [ADP-forming] subunit beta n=1 Tax=Longilinea arvoryzae TaxID=360412 RepID=A0A0S7BMP3_9CHLR|nr:ADP-forming succinate--CoA ligase subunit beta [Longilinea arvoryzae]GAP14986.1 succinyl-CoA synthetase, beta subunit [Longilinea arvoryzae]